MIIKPALFACVIAAAFGCRSDRNERDLEYGRGVEATSDRVDQEDRATNEMGGRASEIGGTAGTTGTAIGTHESGAGAGAAATAPSGSMGAGVGGAQPTTRTDQAGHTVHVTGADRGTDDVGTTNMNTGASVQGRTGAPARRGTAMGFGTRYNSAAGTAGTAGTDAVDTPTGTSETASGHGTTTDTGINTENAGTGGTDNPQR